MTCETETLIRFDRLLDRRLVHRRANAEVLLTALEPTGAGWVAGVQIPRGHTLLWPGADRLPEVLALEAARQICIALGHTAYAVPRDWAFTLQQARFAWAGPPACVPRREPLELWADIEVTGEQYRQGGLSGLDVRVAFRDGDDSVATAEGAMRVIAPRHYRALRRGAPERARIPVRHDVEPVLGRPDGTVVLGYDLDDPFFFDHVPDHLPGMLVAHAMTHLHRRTDPDRPVARVEVVFHRFAEYEPLPEIRGERTPGGTLYTVTQGDAVVATGSVMDCVV